jgi:transcriptional regulator with AAA-type ATPase domain
MHPLQRRDALAIVSHMPAAEGPTADNEAMPALAKLPTAVLYLIMHAPGVTQVITLDDGDRVIVGRGADAGLRVDSTDVSRAHAAFQRRGPVVEVEDLGSRNGTWRDGQRLASGLVPLSPGAAVRVGPALIGLAVCAETLGGVVAPAGPPQGGRPPAVAGDGQVVIAEPAMAQLYADAHRVARTPCTVLITGETGTGKEILAEHIHRASPRANGRFVRLNCAAMPETLLESELFGSEKGAFTGADRRREGWIETASGGTLYLDEIGEMPLAMQAKLLRVLENKRLMRLGSTTEIAVDLRIVCATHRDLEAAVAAGSFRADLYYRLATVVLAIPPLRERPAEIALLASRFAAAFAASMATPVPAFEPEATAALLRHRWPGNVRELRNAVERAAALCHDARITVADLPDSVRAKTPSAPGAMRARLDEAEHQAIESALASENGNQTRAARRLGISRRNLVYKLTKYGLR